LAQIGHRFGFKLILEGLSHAVLTQTQGCLSGRCMNHKRAAL
jgi:hypothetical protein